MKITFVVEVDLTPAVDDRGWMDDDEAARIAHRSSDYPDGATIRLNIGKAHGGALFKLNQMFQRAGGIEITGSNIAGMRIFGDYLSGSDPYKVI